MALPNLHGYWKYADSVVPFRIEPIDRPQVAPSFIARPQKPVIQKAIKGQALKVVANASNGLISTASNGNGQGKHSTEITSEMIDDIDIGF